MTFINKRSIYGNENNACVLCEYKEELKLLKQLINLSEKLIGKQAKANVWSHDGICHFFAKTIVDYSKMAYDNILLGHLHAVNMISRACLENLVCLDIIENNQSFDLWKYYLVYSYRSAIYKAGRTPTNEELDRLQEIYENFNISEDFYIKQVDRKKAYIQEQYGWTYKINRNKQFTFKNICDLSECSTEYKGFSLMSEFSHGTSFYTKIHSDVFIEDMMNILINLYINLYRMITIYYEDETSESFDKIAVKLEEIFYRYINYEESINN